MSERSRLPNRRASEQVAFVCNDLKYVARVSFFPDCRLAEIFLGKPNGASALHWVFFNGAPMAQPRQRGSAALRFATLARRSPTGGVQ
jgi:hypothetical protein